MRFFSFQRYFQRLIYDHFFHHVCFIHHLIWVASLLLFKMSFSKKQLYQQCSGSQSVVLPSFSCAACGSLTTAPPCIWQASRELCPPPPSAHVIPTILLSITAAILLMTRPFAAHAANPVKASGWAVREGLRERERDISDCSSAEAHTASQSPGCAEPESTEAFIHTEDFSCRCSFTKRGHWALEE